MSNYNDNLRQTVTTSLSTLNSKLLELHSQKTSAAYNNYYAVGAKLTARQKRARTANSAENYVIASKQATYCGDEAVNMLASVTQTNTNVLAGAANMATAAANIQIASNAIMKVASDIGAALNIATASHYETDTYHKIKDANQSINRVANDAKHISLKAMEATSYTAEIISAATLAQANVVKSQVDGVMAAVGAEYDAYAKQSIAESVTISEDDRAQRKADGILKSSRRQVKAIQRSYDRTNISINYGLEVEDVSLDSVTVGFAPPACSSEQRPMGAQYYALFCPVDKLDTLTTDQAEQMFAAWDRQTSRRFIPLVMPASAVQEVDGSPAATPSSSSGQSLNEGQVSGLVNYVKPDSDSSASKKPAGWGTWQIKLAYADGGTDDGADAAGTGQQPKSKMGKSVDIFDAALTPGTKYAVCLYIEPSLDYKRFVGVFSDVLSAASANFLLAEQLPTIAATAATVADTSVTFEVSGFPIMGGCDFRCILVAAPNWSGDPKSKPDATSLIPFTQSIALQVAPTNFTLAKDSEGESDQAVVQPAEGAAMGGGSVSAQRTVVRLEVESDSISFALTQERFCAFADVTDADDNLVEGTGSGAASSTEGASQAAKTSGMIPGTSSRGVSVDGTYKASFDSTTTDNFGNLLDPSNTYYVYVLAVPTKTARDSFVASLSSLSTSTIDGSSLSGRTELGSPPPSSDRHLTFHWKPDPAATNGQTLVS